MGKIGAGDQQLQQLQNLQQNAKPSKDIQAAQQAMNNARANADSLTPEEMNQTQDTLSGLLGAETADAIVKAKMDPNSLDFKSPDKQHVRALKDALKALNQIPDDTLQEMNLGKMKTKLEETLQQLQNGGLSQTTLDKLSAQMNRLSENVPGASEIREGLKDALGQLQSMLDKNEAAQPTEPKPPAHMRPNHMDPDAPHIMKYASVFAK